MRHGIYRFLLGLYPTDFQVQFGEEMTAVFEEAARRRRERGRIALFLFYTHEALGVVAGAVREHAAGRRRAAPEDLPFPSDIASAERFIEIASRRVIHAIANHDFAEARYYDMQDRKARALLVRLRG
jgi:hypothetical protein